jgi:outer membrane assembly lipoprotein YfiO
MIRPELLKIPTIRAASTLRAARAMAVAACLSLGLLACSGNQGDAYVERPAEEFFAEGEQLLEARRFEEAARAFEEVERQHPYSQLAVRAQIMAGYAYFEGQLYEQSISALRAFIDLHPGHRDVPYAHYLIGMSYYERISDVGRDQEMTEEALQAFGELVRRFPESEYARDAQLKMDLAFDHLAGKEMEIGRYYQRRQQYVAAINRFRTVVEAYDTTTHVPEALHRLTESYLALGVPEEARNAAAVLGYNYPESVWYERSYALVGAEGARAGGTNGANASGGSWWAASSERRAGRPAPASGEASNGRPGAPPWRERPAPPMLLTLAIRDIVLIERLDLEFAPGLTVLTGETGAGKSIILDALGLVLGARADRSLLRSGAVQGAVSASFQPPDDHAASALLAEQDLATGDDLVLVRRSIGADGRSRAFVNDAPVSGGTLRALGDLLVEVHGQMDQRGLTDTRNHRAVLDAFASHDKLLAATRAAHAAWRGLEAAIAERLEAIERARRDEDYLRHRLIELEALDARPGEEERLAQERTRLLHKEKLTAALGQALGDLGGNDGATARLGAAERRLLRAPESASALLQPALLALERALIEAGEAEARIEAALREVAEEEQSLEALEDRLFALRDAARKHRVAVDLLPDLLERTRDELAGIDPVPRRWPGSSGMRGPPGPAIWRRRRPFTPAVPPRPGSWSAWSWPSCRL